MTTGFNSKILRKDEQLPNEPFDEIFQVCPALEIYFAEQGLDAIDSLPPINAPSGFVEVHAHKDYTDRFTPMDTQTPNDNPPLYKNVRIQLEDED